MYAPVLIKINLLFTVFASYYSFLELANVNQGCISVVKQGYEYSVAANGIYLKSVVQIKKEGMISMVKSRVLVRRRKFFADTGWGGFINQLIISEIIFENYLIF